MSIVINTLKSILLAAKLGAIFVPLNFRAKADELAYMIGNSEVKVLFVGERYIDLVNSVRPQLPRVKEVFFDRRWDKTYL
jgi:acyl-CoA synthetase (AMP-forming)/AMP-acid ligase II